MHELSRFIPSFRRGSLQLADLDPWVQDSALYEAERESVVRSIVRRHVSLFPGEALPATTSRPAIPGADAPPSDLYVVYLREIRRIPPMERSEEFRYAIALELAKNALELEMKTPRPTRAEISAMEAAVASKDPTFLRALRAIRPKPSTSSELSASAQERVARVKTRFEEMLAWKRVLVFRTLPLVPGMARKYRGMGVSVMDLIQEANASLMKATDRYEWRKGVRFVVYARWWVQQGILKSLSCHSRTVRTPVYLAQKLKKIRDLNDRAYTGTGSHLSAAQIGEALDEPTARVERALAAAKLTVSIDRELDPSGDFALRDVLADPRPQEMPDAPPGPPL